MRIVFGKSLLILIPYPKTKQQQQHNNKKKDISKHASQLVTPVFPILAEVFDLCTCNIFYKCKYGYLK